MDQQPGSGQVRSILAQPSANEVWARHRRVVDHLTDMGPDQAAERLDTADAEIMAFTGFPEPHWRQCLPSRECRPRDGRGCWGPGSDAQPSTSANGQPVRENVLMIVSNSDTSPPAGAVNVSMYPSSSPNTM